MLLAVKFNPGIGAQMFADLHVRAVMSNRIDVTATRWLPICGHRWQVKFSTLTIAWLLVGISFALFSCATITGPPITSEEENHARLVLLAEAEVFQRAQQKN